MKKSRIACVTATTVVFLLWAAPGRAGLLNVDYKALVSRADLDYNEPARVKVL
jgi:hypothetical protein